MIESKDIAQLCNYF